MGDHFLGQNVHEDSVASSAAAAATRTRGEDSPPVPGRVPGRPWLPHVAGILLWETYCLQEQLPDDLIAQHPAADSLSEAKVGLLGVVHALSFFCDGGVTFEQVAVRPDITRQWMLLYHVLAHAVGWLAGMRSSPGSGPMFSAL